eukprot:4460377-Alexandrium_andersonii.AAC.1
MQGNRGVDGPGPLCLLPTATPPGPTRPSPKKDRKVGCRPRRGASEHLQSLKATRHLAHLARAMR